LRNFEFESLDEGRLIINREWRGLFTANGLATFDSLMQHSGGTVAKNVLRERTTTRFELTGADRRVQAFFIKRHGRPPWKEYVKPLLRLTTPILGARNEWNAILRFHEMDIPTMIPVCLGESRGTSFLVTKALEGFQKLSEWMDEQRPESLHNGQAAKVRDVIQRVAEIAKAMHGAGMHHQDFYLTHLLLPLDESADGIHVIDLGRVRRRRPLSSRWIIKDLAQLNYSAPMVSRSDRRRFLDIYLGRPAGRGDHRLVKCIKRKSESIARHSKKNGL